MTWSHHYHSRLSALPRSGVSDEQERYEWETLEGVRHTQVTHILRDHHVCSGGTYVQTCTDRRHGSG